MWGGTGLVNKTRMSAMSALQRPSEFFDGDEMVRLRQISTWRSLWGVLHCWSVILTTWVVVALWTNPVTILLGIVIIGSLLLGGWRLSRYEIRGGD